MPATKRCRFCGRRFRPDPRARNFQKACAKPACRRQRKRQADADWRRRNPDFFAARRTKVRQWARDFPGYWKNYRAAHPEYRAAERERMRRKRALRVAKQDAISQDPVGFLADIRAKTCEAVAKQDAMAAQIDGILDYLVVRARVAKSNDIAAAAAPAL